MTCFSDLLLFIVLLVLFPRLGFVFLSGFGVSSSSCMLSGGERAVAFEARLNNLRTRDVGLAEGEEDFPAIACIV